MTKILFFDTETTGLDPQIHGIHQLAGELVINDVLVDSFDYRIAPFASCEIDDEALAVSKTKSSDFWKYNKEFQIHYQLDSFLEKHKNYRDEKDKIFLAGWRAPEFDVKFLKAFIQRSDNKKAFDYYFWNSPVDVKTLATQYLLNERPQMNSFSLQPVAKHLGIEVDESKLHTAAYDAYLCRMVYNVVTSNLVNE